MAISVLRFRRFSLTSLLLAVTCLACLFGWLGIRLREAAKQRNAVATIEKTGGVFEYDYVYYDIGKPKWGGQPNGPRWLRRLFGDEFFNTPVGLYLYNSRDVASALSKLDSLPHLKFLLLGGSSITDADMQRVAELQELRILNLRATEITDAGVVYLRSLTSLEGLDLMGCAITDASVAVLTSLSALDYLNVCGTKLSQKGISALTLALPDREIRTGDVVRIPFQPGDSIHAAWPPSFRDVDGRLVD